jgi:hypothetical protein
MSSKYSFQNIYFDNLFDTIKSTNTRFIRLTAFNKDIIEFSIRYSFFNTIHYSNIFEFVKLLGLRHMVYYLLYVVK